MAGAYSDSQDASALAAENARLEARCGELEAALECKVTERTLELAKARDELAETVASLKNAQAVRDRFFANINHEIRTPLSMILLAAADIRKRDSRQMSARSLLGLGNVEHAVEVLVGLVDNLLLLAASQEGKLQLRVQEDCLAAGLRRLVSMWEPAASEHKVRIVYSGPESLTVRLDCAALERAVSNLISNSLKFTPTGGSIGVRLAEEGSQISITVRDTGRGIDEEVVSRLFGRFEHVGSSIRRSAGGTGIGLSIVKELIVAHGGTIDFENNPAGGAIFQIRLPRRLDSHPEPSDAAPSLQQRPVGVSAPRTGQAAVGVVLPRKTAVATVLVAEDNDTLRSEIVELLSDDYKVLAAPDGTAALPLLREHAPDVLVTDIAMPGMDGLELLRHFRALNKNRLAPVILLTTFGQLDARLAGLGAGAVDYITKPFEPRELLARIKSQLEIRALAMQLSRSEKLASLGVLSAGLAHEIRNPANALLNAMEPLLALLPEEFKRGDSDTGQLLEVVGDCAAQIGRLSKQLLGFSNASEVHATEQHVEALVRRALSILEPPLRGITVDLDLSYPGRVTGAGPMLVQVLVNLIENAAHAAKPGGWIRIHSHVAGATVVLEVSDSGGGVPLDLRERIFLPFFTTKPPGQGTGLGLSTSRQIVEQHQGRVAVCDGAEGTLFRIELPIDGPRRLEQEQVAS